MKLSEKKIIIIGDRDGVHGEEIASALEKMGYDVSYSATECFVCTAAGSMDFPTQQRIAELARGKDPSNFVVILGVCDEEGATVHAKTVTSGDPSRTGALARVQLHLPVYHVFEKEVKDQIDKGTYSQTIGVVESSLDQEEVKKTVDTVRKIREGRG